MRPAIRRILLAYNASEVCDIALSCAADLARRSGADLHAVTVGVPALPRAGFGWIPETDEAEPVNEAIRNRLESAAKEVAGLSIHTHFERGALAQEVAALAERISADLVVLGRSRLDGLERAVLGSNADRIARLAPVPCLAVAPQFCGRRVVVALDDSDYGRSALRSALSLSAVTGGTVSCVHVVGEAPGSPVAAYPSGLDRNLGGLEEAVRRFVEETRESWGEGAPPVSVRVREGPILVEVLAEAEEAHADLVVAGTHGRGFFRRLFLGSVSEGLLREASPSVLVVPLEKAADDPV